MSRVERQIVVVKQHEGDIAHLHECRIAVKDDEFAILVNPSLRALLPFGAGVASFASGFQCLHVDPGKHILILILVLLRVIRA